MLNIASEFFRDLFEESLPNTAMVNHFLNFVQPLKTEKELVFQDLCQEFTIEELKEAIFSFKNGTSPQG